MKIAGIFDSRPNVTLSDSEESPRAVAEIFGVYLKSAKESMPPN